MTVYADVLVIVNLYVDYILLCLVRRFLCLAVPGYRLVLGAAAGGLLSLSGLLPVPGWAALPVAGLVALVTAACAFAPGGGWRMLLRCWLCLWGASFLLAGAVLFALQFLPAGHMAVVGTAVYLDLSLPVLFAATCGAYLALALLGKLLPKGPRLPLARLALAHRGRACTIYAKADTGCALREPFSGLPVIVCQRSALGDLAPPKGEPMRVVPYESLGGRGLLYAFKPDRVTGPGDAPLDCYVGVTDAPLGQYAALYNPDMFL